MDKKFTASKGRTKLIVLNLDVYSRLLEKKSKVIAETGKSISFSDIIAEVLA